METCIQAILLTRTCRASKQKPLTSWLYSSWMDCGLTSEISILWISVSAFQNLSLYFTIMREPTKQKCYIKIKKKRTKQKARHYFPMLYYNFSVINYNIYTTQIVSYIQPLDSFLLNIVLNNIDAYFSHIFGLSFWFTLTLQINRPLFILQTGLSKLIHL